MLKAFQTCPACFIITQKSISQKRKIWDLVYKVCVRSDLIVECAHT